MKVAKGNGIAGGPQDRLSWASRQPVIDFPSHSAVELRNQANVRDNS